MYRFNFREDLGYLEAELAGFWTLDELIAFDRDMGKLVATYAPRFPNFPMLSDSRAFPVQSPEVSQAFAACSRVAAERHPAKVAIVISSTLKKMQSQRVVVQNFNTQFFTSMVEGRAWIEQVAQGRCAA